MKKITFLLLVFYSLFSTAQVDTKSVEQFPVFPACENLQSSALETCFYNQVQEMIYKEFKVPENLKKNNFKGNVIVLFEVDDKGNFRVQYVDANDAELIDESKRVFTTFPKIAPPMYNGIATYSKYTIKIAIPLKSPAEISAEVEAEKKAITLINERTKELTEFDKIVYKKFDNPQFKSNLNIQFSHSLYSHFESSLNKVGSNNHTGSKPYTYAEVAKYFNIKEEYDKNKRKTTDWWSRKLWNENTAEIQGDGYWFTLNPILDIQLGNSNPGKTDYTFVNTRGIQFQGGLGEQINFSTTIFESQGRFADYYNEYAQSIKPTGGDPAVIPGIGIAKQFKLNSYDFPSAEANLSFTPSRFINLQLGYGRNFIGDGYRSLLESDGASPYPYVKINTNFWKIKYTNTYMWLKDIRPEATLERTYATKYMANHYFSWNISKRTNIGFFESVIWTNSNDRGFDMNFVNPIIFYRTVEFTSSARTGNALLGTTIKYKWNNQTNFYGQFLLDEFSLEEVKKQSQSWKNKFGYQFGVKFFNAFKVDNLLLQLEYNHVRPYVYAHSNPITNYGHNNQSLGHQWGGNFKELVAIARYRKGRLYGDLKMTVGKRGLDFDTPEDGFNYGGNIYKNYEENRPFDSGVKVGQGNTTSIFIVDFQAGYLINPSTNLKMFGSMIYRNFDPTQESLTTFKNETTWFSLGFRSDIFNWYLDY